MILSLAKGIILSLFMKTCTVQATRRLGKPIHRVVVGTGDREPFEPGEESNYVIQAKQVEADGTATGVLRDVIAGSDERNKYNIKGDIECLFVEGNKAAVFGTLTEDFGAGDDFEFSAKNQPFFTVVEDGDPDKATGWWVPDFLGFPSDGRDTLGDFWLDALGLQQGEEDMIDLSCENLIGKGIVGEEGTLEIDVLISRFYKEYQPITRGQIKID